MTRKHYVSFVKEFEDTMIDRLSFTGDGADLPDWGGKRTAAGGSMG